MCADPNEPPEPHSGTVPRTPAVSYSRAGRSRDWGEQRYCGSAEAVFFVVGEEVLAFVDELANGCGGDVVSASYA